MNSPAGKPHILAAAALGLILVAGLVNLLSLPDRSEAESPARETITEKTEAEQKAAKQVDKLKATQKTQRRKVDEAQERLDAAVSALEEDGYTVSYIICNLNTANTLEYNADAIHYSASTIKAPFVISVMEGDSGDYMRAAYGPQVEATLVNSDNEAYSTLRKAYYSQPYWSDFCARAQVDPENAHWYKHLSVREMARLWTTAHPWLSSGSENAQWICDLLSDSYKSLIDDLAGPAARSTWSKAGWYAGDPEFNVTFNAGIVNADFGSYVISVAISKGSDFEALQSIMEPLFDTWNASHQLPAAAA